MTAVVAYVVLHYERTDLTTACVESIRQYDATGHLVVVDNGSVTPFRAAELIRLEENRSLTRAMNAGVRQVLRDCVEEIIVMSTNDVIFTATTSTGLRQAFASDSRLGVAAPVMNQRDAGSAYHDFDGKPGPETDRLLQRTIGGRPTLLTTIVDNVVFAVRRRTLEECGLLSENYTAAGWGANDDYCWRARRHGWLIGLVRASFVFHGHRGTWSTLDPDYESNAMRRMLFESARTWGDLAPAVLHLDDAVWDSFCRRYGADELIRGHVGSRATGGDDD